MLSKFIDDAHRVARGVGTYFAKSRSCSELPPESVLLSSLFEAASCSLCFSFEPDKVSLIFCRLLSLSDDVTSRPDSWMTGIGSSRFARASAVEFSIMIEVVSRIERSMRVQQRCLLRDAVQPVDGGFLAWHGAVGLTCEIHTVALLVAGFVGISRTEQRFCISQPLILPTLHLQFVGSSSSWPKGQSWSLAGLVFSIPYSFNSHEVRDHCWSQCKDNRGVKVTYPQLYP